MDNFKKLILTFSRRPFIRGVATMASGTASSQAITIAFSPLITRLYGPEVFGLQGIFLSVVNVLVVVAGLGYPSAIILPKRDSDAVCLIRLSLFVAIGMSLFTAIILSFLGLEILLLLNAEAISGLINFIPLTMFLIATATILSQWLIRKKAYGLSARYMLLGTLVTNAVKITGGWYYPAAFTLIVSNLFGSLLCTIMTWLGWRSHSQNMILTEGHNVSSRKLTLFELARQYSDFPLLRTPQNLINALSQSMPILLLSSFFGSTQAGQYAIALAVLSAPASLIGGSVMSVFYPRINEAIHKRKNVRQLIVSATLGMAATGALPYLSLAIAGPILFENIFGKEWHAAGIYAQLLSAWLFLQYINKPAIAAIPALRLHGRLLVYEVFSTSSKVLALWLGFVFFKSDVIAVGLFSLFGALAYLWLIIWVVNASAEPNRIK